MNSSSRSPDSWPVQGLAWLISALLLCWPAVLNGGAFFFPDTPTYLRGADAVVGELTGWYSEWSDKLYLYDASKALAPGTVPSQGQGAGTLPEPLHPVLLNRSIYYGLLIFPFVVLFSTFGAALLQAFLAVFVIRLMLRVAGVQPSALAAWLVITSAMLAGMTSLPFFVSLLMPDVFAGFGIALAVAAAFGWPSLSSIERVCLALLLAFSAMAHSSHVLLLLALFGLGVFVRLATRSIAPTGLAIILVAALSGPASEALFAQAVTQRLGEAPIRPPFLTARLIDEGPGYALLKDKCPSIKLEACRFLDRMPRDSDTFLWSLSPKDGVFSAEPHPVQRRLAEQDVQFALATVRHDPVALLRRSAESAALQAVMTRLNIFNAPPVGSVDSELGMNLPPSLAQRVETSRYAARTMPVRVPEFLIIVSTIVSSVVLIALILLGIRSECRTSQRAAIAAGLLLFGVCANAAVTGALSKPHHRYNTRVIWVLPLAALALWAPRVEARLKRKTADAVT